MGLDGEFVPERRVVGKRDGEVAGDLGEGGGVGGGEEAVEEGEVGDGAFVGEAAEDGERDDSGEKDGGRRRRRVVGGRWRRWRRCRIR